MIAAIAAVPLCAEFLPGVHSQSIHFSLIAGAVLALIYLVLRPLVKLVTKVFSILTLGLLSVFVDAWLVQLCVSMMNGGLVVDSFWWAAAVALGVNTLRLLVGVLFKK